MRPVSHPSSAFFVKHCIYAPFPISLHPPAASKLYFLRSFYLALHEVLEAELDIPERPIGVISNQLRRQSTSLCRKSSSTNTTPGSLPYLSHASPSRFESPFDFARLAIHLPARESWLPFVLVRLTYSSTYYESIECTPCPDRRATTSGASTKLSNSSLSMSF
jgi:hypothetical protein